MHAAALASLPADVFVAAAAVADWRVESIGANKLKKGAAGAPVLSLIENPDILADVATRTADRPAFVVGFAAETERVVENARDKLKRKGCDLIVANSVAEGAGTFGGLDNQVAIVSATGVEAWPRMTKQEVAQGLIDLIARMMKDKR
jgi:phosphopantothenoylcysteine decarboxylase/phosphopantothenate--cysteine ligase